MSRMMMPTALFVPRMPCAAASGMNLSFAIMRSTRFLMMGPTVLLPFRTRDTVPTETPADWATSRIVGLARGFERFDAAVFGFAFFIRLSLWSGLQASTITQGRDSSAGQITRCRRRPMSHGLAYGIFPPNESSLRTQGPITPGLKSEKRPPLQCQNESPRGRDERNCAHAGVPAFAGTTFTIALLEIGSRVMKRLIDFIPGCPMKDHCRRSA